MTKSVTKREFLARAIGRVPGGGRLPALMAGDAYVRDNVRVACQALQLKLVRLRLDPDGFGYEIVATAAGRLLHDDRLDEAAASVNADRTPPVPVRLNPDGMLAARIEVGRGLPLDGSTVRQHAVEALCAIAAGQFVVRGEYLRLPVDESWRALGHRFVAPARDRGQGGYRVARR